jgi:hypothetical protein
MSNTDLKKDLQTKLTELRKKRKAVIANFKKKVEEAKIEQIRGSLLNK